MQVRKLSDRQSVLRAVIVVALIALAVVVRLLPHPANFAPVAAVAIFGGALLPRRWALILPLTVMVLSDVVIGFHSTIWATWGSFVMIALMSNRYLSTISPLRVVGAGVASASFFFLATNLAVWLQGTMYDMSLAGLAQCYYNALPFFRNTLLSDVLYTSLLFSVYVVVSRHVLHESKSVVANI